MFSLWGGNVNRDDKFCQYRGHEIVNESDKFCTNCGIDKQSTSDAKRKTVQQIN